MRKTGQMDERVWHVYTPSRCCGVVVRNGVVVEVDASVVKTLIGKRERVFLRIADRRRWRCEYFGTRVDG